MIKRFIIGLAVCVLAGANLAPVALAGEEALPAPDQQPTDILRTTAPEQEASDGEVIARVEERPASPALPTMSESEGEEPPLVLPSILINRVVAGMPNGQSSYDYIELYNPNPHDVFIDAWRLIVLRERDSTSNQQIFTIHGTVKAKSYVQLAGSAASQANSDFRLQSDLIYGNGIVQLVNKSNAVVEEVTWGISTPDLASNRMLDRNYSENVPYLTGDMSKDFSIREPVPANAERAGGYEPYVEPINRCTGLIISEIAANAATDKQFIELYNPTSLPVILDGCLLQTNRSTTKSYTLSGVLQPGGYKELFLAPTGLTLTKTTAGTVYILSSDGKEETDARSYEGLAENTSWAWFGGEWKQTFSPTPGRANQWQEFLPCESGYERNLETGRCRKVVAATVSVECGPGKYRSPETNRCRNVEAADILTPCKTGQYRNPETNRCRSLASAASTPAPCKPDQERNPETNRCRKKAASGIPESAFAIEPVKETGKAFAGWWVLGGLGTLAAGRGVWEWRSEMLSGIRKIGSFFTSGK